MWLVRVFSVLQHSEWLIRTTLRMRNALLSCANQFNSFIHCLHSKWISSLYPVLPASLYLSLTLPASELHCSRNHSRYRDHNCLHSALPLSSCHSLIPSLSSFLSLPLFRCLSLQVSLSPSLSVGSNEVAVQGKKQASASRECECEHNRNCRDRCRYRYNYSHTSYRYRHYSEIQLHMHTHTLADCV